MRYRVLFLKDICDSSGHSRPCLQSSIEVEAASPEAALGEAQRVFCCTMHVSESRFYADEFDVRAVEPKSASQGNVQEVICTSRLSVTR